MSEEIKVTETPKVSGEDKLIENPRAAIEQAVILQNETVDEVIVDKPVEEKVVTEEPVEEISAIELLKQTFQKRIGKVVAKQKSAEEELVEARAEIERLKSPQAVVADKKNDAPPTIEQVEAYIIKMAEEGNKKEEIAATRYLIKLEKESAIREVEEKQKSQYTESVKKAEAENAALSELAKDYVSFDSNGKPDLTSNLTLANQKGQLFKTAMALYNDKELFGQFYNDSDRALGFRRAVQDANRELHAQGLIKTPKVELAEIKRVNRQVLADPDASDVEDIKPSQNQNLLSDAEKVREEIKSRNRMRMARKVS